MAENLTKLFIIHIFFKSKKNKVILKLPRVVEFLTSASRLTCRRKLKRSSLSHYFHVIVSNTPHSEEISTASQQLIQLSIVIVIERIFEGHFRVTELPWTKSSIDNLQLEPIVNCSRSHISLVQCWLIFLVLSLFYFKFPIKQNSSEKLIFMIQCFQKNLDNWERHLCVIHFIEYKKKEDPWN